MHCFTFLISLAFSDQHNLNAFSSNISSSGSNLVYKPLCKVLVVLYNVTFLQLHTIVLGFWRPEVKISHTIFKTLLIIRVEARIPKRRAAGLSSSIPVGNVHSLGCIFFPLSLITKRVPAGGEGGK